MPKHDMKNSSEERFELDYRHHIDEALDYLATIMVRCKKAALVDIALGRW